MWMSIRQLSKLSGISEKRIRSYILSGMRYYQEVEGWILRMKNYYNENDKKTAAWLRELIQAGMIADGDVDDRSIEEVTAKDVMGYVQCHWFAGIGGWSYSLRLAGWPDDRPVWTGSCPCQPFSVAGKRQGEKDSRHLWPVFARLIRECKPVTVFGEQVASKDGRKWLSGVFADLEAMGYRRAGADLCAAGVGAPHIRQRLFWVGVSGSDSIRMRLQREWKKKEKSWTREQFERLVQAELRLSVPAGKSGGLVDGVPERVVRLRGYGNAIIPQTAAMFIRAFMDSDSQENLHQNDIRDFTR